MCAQCVLLFLVLAGKCAQCVLLVLALAGNSVRFRSGYMLLLQVTCSYALLICVTMKNEVTA